MTKIIIIVLSVWLIWGGYQYFTKSQIAYVLMQQEIDRISSCDFKVLLEKAGKGFEYKEIKKDGKKYWLSWQILKSPSDTYGKEGTNIFEICGHVDFIELAPFTNLRTGFPFRLILKEDYE